MDTMFMNFENSKTCDPHRLLLNLNCEISLDLNCSENCVIVTTVV